MAFLFFSWPLIFVDGLLGSLLFFRFFCMHFFGFMAIPSLCSTCFGVLGLLTFLVSIFSIFPLSSIYGFQFQVGSSSSFPFALLSGLFLVWGVLCVLGQASCWQRW
jgi:hypothetical protein